MTEKDLHKGRVANAECPVCYIENVELYTLTCGHSSCGDCARRQHFNRLCISCNRAESAKRESSITESTSPGGTYTDGTSKRQKLNEESGDVDISLGIRSGTRGVPVGEGRPAWLYKLLPNGIYEKSCGVIIEERDPCRHWLQCVNGRPIEVQYSLPKHVKGINSFKCKTSLIGPMTHSEEEEFLASVDDEELKYPRRSSLHECNVGDIVRHYNTNLYDLWPESGSGMCDDGEMKFKECDEWGPSILALVVHISSGGVVLFSIGKGYFTTNGDPGEGDPCITTQIALNPNNPDLPLHVFDCEQRLLEESPHKILQDALALYFPQSIKSK